MGTIASLRDWDGEKKKGDWDEKIVTDLMSV